ncbi:MAG: YDG domain-containing protein, partial [Candidatus Omnitrophica bacterium]|nr:YDG domain-containing protein [Candidatus Omnitrophota bacterium]
TAKTVTVAGIAKTGADSANYQITQPTTTANITARAITVTAAGATKVYDASTSSSGTPTITTGALQGNDTVTWTQTYDNKNVGTSKVLTPAGTVTDDNAGANYSVTYATVGTGTITAKALTVTGITADNKYYDGTTAATLNTTNAFVNGTISGDTVELIKTNATGAFNNANEGTWTVTISGLTLQGVSATNYSITQPTTTAGIKSLNVSWAGNSSLWDSAGNWNSGLVPISTCNVTIPYINGMTQPILSGSKTLASLTIDSGASLTLTTSTNLTLTGNLANNGSFNAEAGSTVTFNGTSIISGTSALPIQFDNVVINAGKTLTGHSTSMKVRGNWTNNGTYNHNNGEVMFNGSGQQNIKTGGSSSAFYRLFIMNSGGVTSYSGWTYDTYMNPTAYLDTSVSFTDALFTNTLFLGFDTAGYDGYYSGYSGYYASAAMKKIAFAAGQTHTITGGLMVSGTQSKLINLVSTVAGSTWYINPPQNTTLYYVFVSDSSVTSGKSITANYSVNGGNNSGWNFGAVAFTGTGNWNDTSYWSNGYMPSQYDSVRVSGNMYLNSAYTAASMTIDSGKYLYLQGNTLTTASGITNSGNLVLTGTETVSGGITNAAGSTVTYTGAGTYNSFAGGTSYCNLAFTGAGTWMPDANLNVSGELSLSNGTFGVNGKTVTANSLNLTGGTFTGGSSGAFTVAGDVSINGGTFTPPPTFNVSGNFSYAAGTFTHNNSTMVFNGSGTQTITPGSNTFYNINYTGSGVLKLLDNITMQGNFENTSGTFNANSKNITLAGNFVNSGSLSGISQVVFNGSGTQTVNAGGASLTEIQHTSASTLQLSADTTVTNFSNTSGTFDGNGKTLTLTGDLTFSNSSATGLKIAVAGSGTSYIHGTTFESLTVTTPGKTVVIDAGATETITGALTLTGAAGNLITLRSSAEGSQWSIDPQGTRNVSYVDVKDCKNINVLALSATGSTNSGNNTNWSFGTTSTPAPAATTTTTTSGTNVIFREQPIIQPISYSPYITIMPTPAGAVMVPTVAPAVVSAAAPIAQTIAPTVTSPVRPAHAAIAPVTAQAPAAQPSAIQPVVTALAFEHAIEIPAMPIVIAPNTFNNIMAVSEVPSPVIFANIQSKFAVANIISPENFNGISAYHEVPAVAIFESISAEHVNAEIITPDIFMSIQITDKLPRAALFAGVKTESVMPQIVNPNYFPGVISSREFLPEHK